MSDAPMPRPELLAAVFELADGPRVLESGEWAHDKIAALLTSQIAAHRREERERCAKVASRYVTPGSAIAAAIRALPTTEPEHG